MAVGSGATICFVLCSLILSLSPGYAVPTNSADTVSGSLREKRWGCPAPGCKGAKGERGDFGPVGPQGYQGIRGPPGYCDAATCWRIIETHLPDKDDDDDGKPGPPGEPGPPGIPGMDGRDGVSGMKGQKGEPGNDGERGPPGPSGEPGTPGRKGVPGLQGPPGMKGLKGDPGQPGEPGLPGADGDPGDRGLQGPKGEKGEPGSRGQPGTDGVDGVDGERGERGAPGPPIKVIPREESEPCVVELQGVIRFDNVANQLYFCNGSVWLCIQAQDCTEPPTCPSPFGPQNIGDQWYQVFVSNVTQGTQDAADIVLIVDESGSMRTEHEWLLVMIPLLEEMLVSEGVGDGPVRNRYCLVGYGGVLENATGHFRPVDGQPCFLVSDFPRAQSQLVTNGIEEDGYEAIQFALDNVPFRESPFIAKNIILITDEGRAIIDEGENITRESIQEQLKARDILLNVVVLADYEVVNATEEVVIGVDSKGLSYLLRPEGKFATTNQTVEITGAEKNTAEAYVDLAICLGGATWAIRILRESSLTKNVTLQESFTSSLIQIKLREIRTVIESCRICTCVPGDTAGTARVSCAIAEDESFCRCVVSSNGDQSSCVPGLITDGDGRIIVNGDPVNGRIVKIELAPDFVILDALENK